MISQQNPKLLPEIQSECYFLVLAWFIEQEFGYQFKVDELNSIFEVCKKNGFVDGKATIIKPDKVLMVMLLETKIKTKKMILQIGQTVDNSTVYWEWVPKSIIENARIYTAAMENTTGKFGTHWIAVQSRTNPIILFDSNNARRIGKSSDGKRFVYYAVFGEAA